MPKLLSKLSLEILASLILLLFSAAVWTESVLYSQNILYNNENWLVTQGGDLQRTEVLVDRAFLAGNTLNLDIQNGHQELESRAKGRPRLISFEFLAHDGAYLDFYFNRGGAGSAESQRGVRISRNNANPSLFFSGLLTGEFTSVRPLPVPPLSGGWHTATLAEDPKGLLLQIDGMNPLQISGIRFTDGAIGFRSSFFGARIKSLDVAYADGQEWHERFRNFSHARATFLATLSLLALLCFAYMGCRPLLSKFSRRKPASVTSVFFRFASFSFCASILWFAFDFLDLSKAASVPPEMIVELSLRGKDDKTSRWEHPGDHVRFLVFDFLRHLAGGLRPESVGMARKLDPAERKLWSGFVLCKGKSANCRLFETKEELAKAAVQPKQGHRILVLGGSMTVGAGARNFQETFFVKLHQRLQAMLFPGPIESINVSETGEKWRESLDLVLALRPDLVFVSNIYQKSIDPQADIGKIQEWLAVLRARGAKALFLPYMPDPDYFEYGRQVLEENAEIPLNMWTAKEFEATLVPMGAQLVPIRESFYGPSLRNSGKIWADNFHMTSYGQSLFAELLAPLMFAALTRP